MLENEIVTALGYGTLASLIAAIIWFFVGKLSKHIRTPFELLSGYFGVGVLRRFSSFNDAAKYIEKGLKNSKEVKFLAIRGFLITHEENAVCKAFHRYFDGKTDTNLKILLADPKGHYAVERAQEFETLRKESSEYYLSQIGTSIDAIKSMKSKLVPDLELRLHDTPAIFRILMFHDYCLVSYYSKEYTGLNSPVLLIHKSSPLYKSYDRYFDACWDSAGH